MRLPDIYQSYISIDHKRLVLIPSGATFDICGIKRGILFILSKWSGASQLAFRALNKALVSVPDLDGVYLYIADTDCDETEKLIFELGDVPGGAGETYWLVEGKVKYKLKGYNEAALSILREFTEHVATAHGP